MFHDAAEDHSIVRLLEADAVTIEVSHHAIGDDRTVAPIEENAGAPAAVEMNVALLVAVDGQVLEARAVDIVSADDRENRRRESANGSAEAWRSASRDDCRQP